jgi:DNA-directed RNA polymerase subunit L
MEESIKRQKDYLAFLIEQRDKALANDLTRIVARYEQVIIATERLVAVLESTSEVTSEIYRQKE